MKKVFVLFLLILSINASAQLSLSFKNGVLISGFNIDDKLDATPLIAYTPEITLGYFLDNFSANIGFSYNKLGYNSYKMIADNIIYGDELTSAIITFDSRYSKSYSYLSMPIFASYFYDINKFYIGADAGFLFNINISAKYKQDNINQDIQGVNSFVPSALFGLKGGYSINKNLSMDITVRHNWLFKDVQQPNVYESKSDEKINSIVILAGINYKF